MDESGVQRALDDIFDQAVLFHGFADYMRDYDLYVYIAPNAQPVGEKPQLRYRFRHCVEAAVRSTVRPDVWAVSMDDVLLEWPEGPEVTGYVWGVRWHGLYPGGTVVPDHQGARDWSERVGIDFMAAVIETNAHHIELVFHDLEVVELPYGTVPFQVTRDSDRGIDDGG